MDKFFKEHDTDEKIKEKLREQESKNKAVMLELMEDLPNSNVKPPENVLFVCRLNPVTQAKDLENIFHFPKSTLADIIQLLENEGLIEKVPFDGDGRKKQIIVTEKGLKFNQATEGQIMEVEDFITKDISSEELETVSRVLEKMQQNARNYKSYIKLKKED
jgi:DNA-binding MarR family transcriptional regulator